MSYQVLARKWRPQDFAAMIGQEPIVTALRNALAEDRIAQAYLFSGIRGVGKTTAARVLAKALNCETRRAENGTDPCNACPSCRQITDGHDMDVIEVDAATYSKVEQVRELTESLRYAPAGDRHKVVVLDEVHRLSRQAFDALLKIVEEPPPHLVFIFATTEIEAVPATILSRCQQFSFRRVPSSLLAAYLATLAERESITASEATLRLIARAGEGSVRDAVALLDQLATFGNKTVREEDAARLIGGLDHGLLARLLGAILEGRSRDVSTAIAEVDALGLDPAGVYGHFVAYVRDALHVSMGGNTATVDLPAEAAEALAAMGKAAGYENLLRLLNLLLASEDTVRRSELGALAIEITLLRAAELPKLTAVEALLAGGSLPPAARRLATEARTAPPVERRAAQIGTAQPAKKPEQATEPHKDRPREPATAEAILKHIGARRPSLAAHLGQTDVRIEDHELVIAVPDTDTLIEQALARPANERALREAIQETLGAEATWRIVRTKRPASPVSEAVIPPESATERTAVQAALDIFEGSKIEHREPTKT